MSETPARLPTYVGEDFGWCHRCRNYFESNPPKKIAGIREADHRRSYEGSLLCVECEEAIEEKEANQ